MNQLIKRPLGAIWTGDERGVRFSAWAPHVQHLAVHLLAPDRFVPMERDDAGYFEAVVPDAHPGTRYMFRLDNDRDRPDPASHFQPESVHGASEVIDPAYDWSDNGWKGLLLREYIFYELHVGTFTKEGTFEAIIPHLESLKDLGITCIEIMPVAQFPGSRNWGYDGVHPFAVQNSYGGPHGLKKLVDACHAKEIAVCLDVVYNHLGPEGNYLWDFGPYFTDRYQTPWGSAVNFDGAESDHVRHYFIQNALRWFDEFHIDALRLDAVHAIFDFSAYPFLQELKDEVEALERKVGRSLQLIAESDLNDTRIIRSRERGGFGLHGQWSDDFHHSVHSLLTGETDGYYEDFGELDHLARVMRDGYTYSGQFSHHRGRRHGNNPEELPGEQFVVCNQNHDQVGNRMLGERLSALVDFESLKLAAATTILSPFQPLLFMGEEYGEEAPFLFFVSHGDDNLIEAVRKGRREEFSSFAWKGEAPDPQATETFERSRLNHSLKATGHHKTLWDFYRELLRLRKEHPVLTKMSKQNLTIETDEQNKLLKGTVATGKGTVVFYQNYSEAAKEAPIQDAKSWRVLLNSAEEKWGGTSAAPKKGIKAIEIPPRSIVVIDIEDSTI